MKIQEIADLVDAEALEQGPGLETEVGDACVSDLMSDVLAFSTGGGVLITGLVNPQVVRTADLLDFKCILFVRSKRPDEQMLRLAREHEIALLCTRKTAFYCAGILYHAGLGEKEVKA